MKRNRRRFGVRETMLMVGGCVALTFGPLACASGWSGLQRTTELSDSTLAQMRGRFVSGDSVMFFGVEMYTLWTTATGQSYAAMLNVGVDRSYSRLRPTVTISGSAQISGGGSAVSGGPVSGTMISSGGLEQVKGVTQVVQVTGESNGIANSIGMDVGAWRRQNSVGISSNGGNHVAVDADSGASTITYVGLNNMGVSIVVPGQGGASQSLSDVLGMQQRAQVFGDFNSIRNNLNLRIQLQDMNVSSRVAIPAALNLMQGLPRAGAY